MQLCFFYLQSGVHWIALHQKSDYEAENQFDWQLNSTKLLMSTLPYTDLTKSKFVYIKQILDFCLQSLMQVYL